MVEGWQCRCLQQDQREISEELDVDEKNGAQHHRVHSILSVAVHNNWTDQPVSSALCSRPFSTAAVPVRNNWRNQPVSSALCSRPFSTRAVTVPFRP
jgi:hypothetical protein